MIDITYVIPYIAVGVGIALIAVYVFRKVRRFFKQLKDIDDIGY